MHEAKYGQLAGSDPVKALQRDSSFADEGNEVDESTIGYMYETQLMQLERLITVQRRCHNRSKQVSFEFKRRKECHSVNTLICTCLLTLCNPSLLAILFFGYRLSTAKHRRKSRTRQDKANYAFSSA